MSLLLLSDTHLRGGDVVLPERLTTLMRTADMIAHAGDIVTVDAFDYLRAAGKTIAVAGNMDQFQLAARLPVKTDFSFSGHKVGLIHGHQAHDIDDFILGPDDDYSSPAMNAFYEYLEAEFSTCDVIVFGHFHVPGVIRRRRKLLINPGTADPRARIRSCAELHVDGGTVVADIIYF